MEDKEIFENVEIIQKEDDELEKIRQKTQQIIKFSKENKKILSFPFAKTLTIKDLLTNAYEYFKEHDFFNQIQMMNKELLKKYTVFEYLTSKIFLKIADHATTPKDIASLWQVVNSLTSEKFAIQKEAELDYDENTKLKNNVPIIPDLDTLVIPKFYDIYKNYIRGEFKYDQYWFMGGRASTKSTFISIIIIKGLMEDINANALCLNKTAYNIRESIYSQFKKSIDMLKLSDYFKFQTSPPKIIRKDTGQVINFAGISNKEALKGLTPDGAEIYNKYVVIEEVNKLSSLDEFLNTHSSVIRGGKKQGLFLTYNTPESKDHWLNVETASHINDKDFTRIYIKSTYLDVPKEWIGEQQLSVIEDVKNNSPRHYKNIYLGEITGSGGAVFFNLENRIIRNYEIDNFNNIKLGLDIGTSEGHPQVAVKCNFDVRNKTLYIYKELFLEDKDLSAKKFKKYVDDTKFDIEKGVKYTFIGDCANKQALNSYRDEGLSIRETKKGEGSIQQGVEFLKNLYKIIIDAKICPNVYKQFSGYEYKLNKDGRFTEDYIDIGDDSVDAVRYALSDYILR